MHQPVHPKSKLVEKVGWYISTKYSPTCPNAHPKQFLRWQPIATNYAHYFSPTLVSSFSSPFPLLAYPGSSTCANHNAVAPPFCHQDLRGTIVVCNVLGHYTIISQAPFIDPSPITSSPYLNKTVAVAKERRWRWPPPSCASPGLSGEAHKCTNPICGVHHRLPHLPFGHRRILSKGGKKGMGPTRARGIKDGGAGVCSGG